MGQFRIGAWSGSSDLTGYMDYYVTAEDMKTSLEALNSVGTNG